MGVFSELIGVKGSRFSKSCICQGRHHKVSPLPDLCLLLCKSCQILPLSLLFLHEDPGQSRTLEAHHVYTIRALPPPPCLLDFQAVFCAAANHSSLGTEHPLIQFVDAFETPEVIP